MSKYLGRQKFHVAEPLESHWERTDCAEDNCKKFMEGWRILVDRELVMPNGMKLGELQYQYIKHKSERRFIETVMPENKVMFTFYPGQNCFEQHNRKIEGKEALFNHRTGPSADKIITTKSAHAQTIEPEKWIDEFNEQSYQFKKMQSEG